MKLRSTWGNVNPVNLPPPAAVLSEFERVVLSFGLKPLEYVYSDRLREWVRRNKSRRYVPEDLLEAWGFRVEVRFGAEPIVSPHADVMRGWNGKTKLARV